VTTLAGYAYLSHYEKMSPIPVSVQEAIARVLVDDPSENVRLVAANALGHVGGSVPPQVSAALLEALKDKADIVRQNAAGSLCQLQPTPAIVAGVTKALRDPHPGTRNNAVVALRKYGKSARESLSELRKLTNDPSSQVRANVAWTLWAFDRDADEVVPILRGAFAEVTVKKSTPDVYMVLAAVREVGATARPLADELVHELRSLKPEVADPELKETIRAVRAELIATLLAIDPETGRKQLPDAPGKDGFPKFKVQEIASDLKIGYAVLIADLNADKKPDIVVVDKHRVVWYENPTWKVRTILQGKTKPDNVCITALDIDGGGDLELVLGAGWGAGTKVPGTLQWLKRGKSLGDEWTLHPIPCDEPTVHRVRVADVIGQGKPQILVAPLQGRECTAKGNWTDGRPVKILAYPVPKDPEKPGSWKPIVVCDSLFVVHNFATIPNPKDHALMYATYDGIFASDFRGNGFVTDRLHPADQDNPKGSRGASEITWTRIGGKVVIATIEPWHGNQVVVYTRNDEKKEFTRHVIDDHLRWGHAINFADLDGDGTGELIAGVRDDPNPKAGDQFTERRGVRLYRCTDGKGEKWERHILENGGVAVEDLTVGDLNGDGKPDIVAVGRATGNCRIYWNQGK
jgi:hypothetical protein